MSIKEKIQDFYYWLLDKYDAAVEKYGKPVVLGVIALVVILIVVGLFFLFSGTQITPEQKLDNVFAFVNLQQQPIRGLKVMALIDEESEMLETNEEGKIIVKAPLNSVIKLSVKEQTINGVNYSSYSESFEVTAALSEKIVLSPSQINFQQSKKIFLQRDDGLPVNKELTVKLECLDASVLPWTLTDMDKDGEIDFELPPNCTKVRVSLTTAGFDSSSVVFLPSDSEKTLIVTEIQPEKGSLEINIEDSAGNAIVTKNFKVTLSFSETGETTTKYTEYYGSVLFENLLPGYYNVSVVDETNEYGIAYKNNILVSARQEAIEYIRISKAIKGIIKVTVIDKASRQKIGNASVLLKDSRDNVLAEKNTDANGSAVEFALIEDFNELKVTAKKAGGINEGYFPTTKSISSINTEVVLELEKITSLNAGKAIVLVIDEENNPVKNAKVMFRSKKTGAIIDIPYEENFKLTDANGKADFILGAIEEEIYAFASKYPAVGGKPEDAKKIDIAQLNEFTVQMTLGNATINIKAIDNENNLVTASTYEIFDSLTNSISGVIPMETGQDTYTLKADNKVFVLVKNPSYLSYQSKEIQLWPNETFNVEALMLPKQENLEIRFEGFYLNGTKTEVLDKGQEYTARFLLIVPDIDFTRVGMHFRLGDSFTLENEPMYIKKVNASNASLILKGTTYNREHEGNEETTEGSAKWVNIEWFNSNNRTIEVEITVKLKENIASGTKLSFYYRAWAVTTDELYARDPLDNELGQAESIEGKASLYAEAYQAIYLMGITRLCEELYCYGKEDLFDEKEKLYLVKPYSTTIFSPYTLTFEITSNDDTEYQKLELLIKNSDSSPRALKIKSYEIKQADSTTIKADLSDSNSYETPRLTLNNFVKGKKISGKLALIPSQLGNGILEIHFIGDNRFIWNTQVEMTIISDNELKIVLLPEIIPAFTPTQLQVKVTDKDNLDVRDVLVRTTIVFKDHTEISFEKYSSSLGYALFDIPALTPGTIIRVEAEKIGFAPAEAEKTIADNIIEIKPASISFNLNTVSKTEETQEITIKNQTGIDLKISDLRLKGNFKGLLDVAAMDAYIKQFKNTQIKALEEIDLAIPKAILSYNAKDLMTSNKNLEGELDLTIQVIEYGSKFNYQVPINVSISLGELPENTQCIILDGPSIPEWKTATQNNIASMQFTISNACKSSGRNIELETLEAKLQYEASSPKAGIITLSIRDPAGNVANETLQEETFITFFKNIKTVDVGTYEATLTFTPKQGYIGKKAEFKVIIDGTIKTASGKQYVGSSPSQINAEISVISLDQCVKYYDKQNNETLELKMNAEEKETTFTVSTEECGAIPVTIELCPQDLECKGGTSEGGIRLSSNRFTLNQQNPTKTITIERKQDQIAGIYGIPVFASTPATSSREINELTIEVKANPSQYFDLERYEFYVQGKDAKDSTALINRMYIEGVRVKANLCNWDEAVKNNKWKNAAISTAAGGLAGIYAASAIAKIVSLAQFAGPIGIAIAIVVAIAVYLMLNKDCSDIKDIKTLEDYVINLAGSVLREKEAGGAIANTGAIIANIPSDAGQLTLKELQNQIKMEWVLNNPRIQTINGRITEIVGLRFTNNSGLEKEKPTYAIGVIQAREHIHGDKMHNPANDNDTSTHDVYCHEGTFAPYWIGPKYDQGECDNAYDTHAPEQKFHLRFITKQQEKVMPPVGEAISCYNGNLIGSTGSGALAKIKLKWGWNDADIPWNACDTKNQNAIFCDATQMSIMLSKRLKMLEDFMAANTYSFSCPVNPEEIEAENTVEEQNSQNSSQEIPEGKIGLKQLSVEVNGRNAKITALIQNNSPDDVSTSVLISLSGPDDYTSQCIQSKEVIKNSSATVECTFNDLAESSTEVYVATAQLTVEGTITTVVLSSLVIAFLIPKTSSTTECWLPKTTALLNGIPGIEYYINKNLPNFGQYVTQQSVRFTNDIKNFEDLRNLLHFRAFLIKDNYTTDFMKDFAELYTTSTFFDAPSYFKSDASGKLADYFNLPVTSNDSAGMSFTQRYIDNAELPGPGTYLVDIDILYLGENWSLFKQGKPQALIQFVFHKIEEPFPNSVFYYMPFDGLVGINSANGRQGYGTDYLNVNEPVYLTTTPTNITTQEAPASNPLVKVTTRIDQSLENLNSRAETRGILLKIGQGSTEKEKTIIFSPSYATPVIMKTTQNKTSDNKVSVFYSFIKNAQPELTGNNMAFWSGLGACLDFTGIPVSEAFNFNADRKALPEDKLTEWQFSYSIDWKKVTNPGVVYLNTIVYTPVSANDTFEVKSNSENMKLMTPDLQESEKISLNGLSGMPKNDKLAMNRIMTIQEILDLVAEGKACISNQGTETTIAWNPALLLTTKGKYLSVKDFEKSLQAGINCIGYAS